MIEYYIYFENKKRYLENKRRYVLGRDSSCDIVLSDMRVSRTHASLERRDDRFLLTDLESRNGTWYGGERITEICVGAGASFRVANSNLSIRSDDAGASGRNGISGDTMLFEKKIAGILQHVNDPELVEDISGLKNLYNAKKEKLARLAFHDVLTGIGNRRFFDEKLKEETERAVRYRRNLSLIMSDIDHFKKINDSYGHQKGDDVLSAVAEILRSSVRSMDIVCRYGGEEIAVILPETDGNSAFFVAEACRKNVETRSRVISGVAVTMSLGVASVSRNVMTSEKLISCADEALYRAKQEGRNRAVLGKF